MNGYSGVGTKLNNKDFVFQHVYVPERDGLFHMQFDPRDQMPKYKQIVHSIKTDIEIGVLGKGVQLPSISELSAEYQLARDTVEKAYRELRNLGYISAVQGKGYYVQAVKDSKERILLVFNKLSSYKKIIYYSFLKTLGESATVDLEIHHGSVLKFREIMEKNLGKYNRYVVMPHFNTDSDSEEDYTNILKQIPASELVLLDRDMPALKQEISSVHQSFDKDIFGALEEANDLIQKYDNLVLIFPEMGNYPKEIIRGFRNYCINYKKEFSIKNCVPEIEPRTAYIVVEEGELAELVKKARLSSCKIGEDIGIISFNETTLKELLEITVITTDFEKMGRTAATLIMNKQQLRVKNPFFMIRRGSL
ncbi:MAG TPA: GntR family transcriptional regulator [Dyadobacter sp.]|jgi:DNA-binding transcriptional regulator YhcF (GntR family)|nr:GntR family transcriptional regulator [Dyadobacter sp.]